MDKCPTSRAFRPSRQLNTEMVWLSKEFASPKSPASYRHSCDLWDVLTSSYTPGNWQSFFKPVPCFYSRMIPPSCLTKVTFLGFSDLAARLIWPSVSRPVSRPHRRSGSLPKALDMVRLLWNMKSWECFAAAA